MSLAAGPWPVAGQHNTVSQLAEVRAAPITELVLSDPVEADINIYRGDTGKFRVTVSAPTGYPLDVSGATWLCQARMDYDSPLILATFSVIPVSGDVSSVDVVINAAASSLLQDGAVWYLQMVLNTDTTTLLTGTVNMQPDVSRVGT